MDNLIQTLINKAWGADDLKKQKAQIKRTVTAINKQRQDLEGLLDAEESQALVEAVRVLDRWTAKAEKALKEKVKAERGEEDRRAERIAIAEPKISERFGSTDIRELAVNGCVLAQIVSPSWPVMKVSEIHEDMRLLTDDPGPHRNPAEWLTNGIKQGFSDVKQELMCGIAASRRPLDELLNDLFDKAGKDEAESSEAYCALKAEINTFLVRHRIAGANHREG